MGKRPLVPSASAGLNKFKMEVAKDMGLEQYTNDKYMGNTLSKQIGKMANSGNVGGEMIKRMIASVENEIANKNK